MGLSIVVLAGLRSCADMHVIFDARDLVVLLLLQARLEL